MPRSGANAGFVYQWGPDPNPKFLWTGATGSRVSGAPFAGRYNRARHYGREQANWTSIDSLWPRQKAYGYVRGNPIRWIDPEGLLPIVPQPYPKPLCPPPPIPGNPHSMTCTPAWNEFIYAYCNCSTGRLYPRICDALAATYYTVCNKPPRGPGRFRPPYNGFGPMIGEVASRPNPMPYNTSCTPAQTPPDCVKKFGEYLNTHFGTGNIGYDVDGAVRTCVDCCASIGGGDACELPCRFGGASLNLEQNQGDLLDVIKGFSNGTRLGID